jgi:DNA-directed RNA polymerase subunit K/omega
MEYIPLEKLLDKSQNSIYKLVVLVSKRSLELAEGQVRLVDNVNLSTKPSTVAMQEIIQGKIKVKS